MDIINIKNAMLDMSSSELAEIEDCLQEIKSMKVSINIQVGQNVWVVQKTKRTSGVVVKINQKKAQINMRGGIYNVPFGMIEAA